MKSYLVEPGKVQIIIFIIILCLTYLTAEEPEDALRQITENEYRLNDITIFKNLREIRFPAEFNMEEGLIELLLCGSRGKLHESVLKTDIIPSNLQVALLLLDFEYGGNLEYQGEATTPEGDSLLIIIEWEDADGELHHERIEHLAYNIRQNEAMPETYWIFSGSKILDGRFMADIEQSLITTYHDPFTIIDNPLETGADDTLYEVNKMLVPPKGTKATIIISEYNLKPNK